MPSEPIRTSRLARYSLVATLATGTVGSAVRADVTSGMFEISWGRAGGTGFFNGFTNTNTNTGNSAAFAGVTMGSLLFFGHAVVDLYGTGTNMNLSIWRPTSGTYTYAYFNNGMNMVDAGAFWQETSQVQQWVGGTGIFGNPDAVDTKYVNFRIGGASATTYGWIQFDWDITDANDWSVTISNWAYTSDGPLAAGDTAGSQAVPGLGGLAALAIGAAGLRGRRQRMAG